MSLHVHRSFCCFVPFGEIDSLEASASAREYVVCLGRFIHGDVDVGLFCIVICIYIYMCVCGVLYKCVMLKTPLNVWGFR